MSHVAHYTVLKLPRSIKFRVDINIWHHALNSSCFLANLSAGPNLNQGILHSSQETQSCSGFLNISRCMGENTPDSPPCTRLRDTLTSISCTSRMPCGARCRNDTMLTRVLLTPINPESLSHFRRPYLHCRTVCHLSTHSFDPFLAIKLGPVLCIFFNPCRHAS